MNVGTLLFFFVGRLLGWKTNRRFVNSNGRKSSYFGDFVNLLSLISEAIIFSDEENGRKRRIGRGYWGILQE